LYCYLIMAEMYGSSLWSDVEKNTVIQYDRYRFGAINGFMDAIAGSFGALGSLFISCINYKRYLKNMLL